MWAQRARAPTQLDPDEPAWISWRLWKLSGPARSESCQRHIPLPYPAGNRPLPGGPANAWAIPIHSSAPLPVTVSDVSATLRR